MGTSQVLFRVGFKGSDHFISRGTDECDPNGLLELNWMDACTRNGQVERVQDTKVLFLNNWIILSFRPNNNYLPYMWEKYMTLL